MLSKKFLSSALAIGLTIGSALSVGANVDANDKLNLTDNFSDFSDILEFPGCVKAVNSALKRMPDKIKERNDIKSFHGFIYTYFKQLTNEKAPLTIEEKAQKIKQLDNNFKNLYNNDVEFREAFTAALYKKSSHASTPNNIEDFSRGKARSKAKIKRCPTTSGE